MDFSKLKGSVPDIVYNELQAMVDTFNINTTLRMAHFIGQCAHESGNFESTSENLNYSAEGLLKEWPSHFRDVDVNDYAHHPVLIANRVYAERMGNGSEASGDGWKYRGRGYIGVTGKELYILLNKHIPAPDNIIVTPDLVGEKYPLYAAGWFWWKYGLNELSDKGSGKNAIIEVSRKVNGGLTGIDDRILQFNKYWAILNIQSNG